ncbi:MAG: tyrosine--tRNA ligase [Elusimicrobia bacterium]|nr:tyrosine--tRNA ligase [Elusimicrobiota bacterium]
MDFEKQLSLLKRGAVNIVSEAELAEKLKSGKKLRIKLGVDPTSSDLHLGHSVVLSKLRQFQDLGHTAVLIIGDFTARVGDPSGRDSTRPMLNEEDVKINAKTYTEQAFKVLDREKTEIRFNSQWLIPFTQHNSGSMSELINTAKNLTVSRILEREDFKNRMKNEMPISLLEILYPVFQGYDSVAVKADVELGGQDQIFNLLMGRDLQKFYSQSPQIVVTVPLLVGTDGEKKMSKSYGNYIALNDSSKDIFGKTMSLSDETMYCYYELLTDKDMNEVKSLHPMEAKKRLAAMLTDRFCGEGEGIKAREEFEKVFSAGQIPQDMEEFKMDSPMKLSQLMVLCKMAKSNNEARRLIEAGAVKIDGKKMASDSIIEPLEGIIQAGKRNFRKLVKGV